MNHRTVDNILLIIIRQAEPHNHSRCQEEFRNYSKGDFHTVDNHAAELQIQSHHQEDIHNHVEHHTARSRSHNYHREEFRNYSKGDFHTVEHRTVDTYTVDHHTAEFRSHSTIGRSSVIIRRGISILWNIVRWIHILLIIIRRISILWNIIRRSSHNYHREEFRNYSKGDFHTVEHRTADGYTVVIIIREESILWNIIRQGVIITIGRNNHSKGDFHTVEHHTAEFHST